MAQSSSELNTIHLRKLATPGRKYYGDNEKVYVGTPTGHLKLLDKAINTTFKPTSSIPSTNVQRAIESLSGRPIVVPTDEIRNTEIEENSIAFAVALGGL